MEKQMEFMIRPSSSADIPTLIELRSILLDSGNHIYSAQDDTAKKQWRISYQRWLEEKAMPDDRICILVAEQAKSICGCATGIIDNRAPTIASPNGLTGWIQSVVVSPTARRQGIAYKLNTNLFTWFKCHDVQCIVLEAAHGSEPLYQKLGFKRNGEEFMTLIMENKN